MIKDDVFILTLYLVNKLEMSTLQITKPTKKCKNYIKKKITSKFNYNL